LKTGQCGITKTEKTRQKQKRDGERRMKRKLSGATCQVCKEIDEGNDSCGRKTQIHPNSRDLENGGLVERKETKTGNNLDCVRKKELSTRESCATIGFGGNRANCGKPVNTRGHNS